VRLIGSKKTGTEPIDRVQYRVPHQYVTDPVRHHSWDIKYPGAKIERACHLNVNLVPGLAERVQHGVEEADTATEQGRDCQGQDRFPHIIWHCLEADRCEPRQQQHSYDSVGEVFDQSACQDDIESGDKRQL